MNRAVLRKSIFSLATFLCFVILSNGNCGSASLSDFTAEHPDHQISKYGYMFCRNCTLTSSNDLDQSISLEPPSPINDLMRFEHGLNTYSPEYSHHSFEIKGSGSTTLGLYINSFDSLENKLVRRLAGFDSIDLAIRHIQNIHTYRQKLHNLDIETTDTQLVALKAEQFSFLDSFSQQSGVVYAIQPYLNNSQLAHKVLETADEETKILIFSKQMEIVLKLLKHNQQHPKDRITLDTALSNWEVYYHDNTLILRLNDLAQPLYEINGSQLYDWHDQASSVIWGLSGRTQFELRTQFEKIMKPREALTELLWGYKGHNSAPDSEAYPYPEWALSNVNQLLKSMNEEPLKSEEVLKKFIDNNYALACLRLIKGLTSTVRYLGSFVGLTHSVHIPKPADTRVDLYGNSHAGLMQCLDNSDTAPEGWYQN